MKRVQFVFVIAALLLAQLACSLLPSARPTEPPLPVDTMVPTVPPTSVPPTATPAPIFSLELLKNFTYHNADYNADLALKDGAFKNDQLDSRLIEPVAIGDLNGDGRQDAAVVLATNGGGSGTFFDLIVLLDQGGAPVQSGYSPIGDRQGIKDLRIEDGRIVLDFLTQALSDPLCCPSEHRLRSYRYENGQVVLTGEQVLDGPNAIAGPLPNEIILDRPALNAILAVPQPVSGRVSQVPDSRQLEYFVTDMQGNLLQQGKIDVQGEAGGPGTFAFELTLENAGPGILQLAVVDAPNGALRGRTIAVLVAN